MGINVDNNNVCKLKEAINYYLSNPGEKSRMGANARKCAEELFDRKKNYKKILNIIESRFCKK